MPTALEVELKTYAHNLVATYVTEEYNNQIRQWQAFINMMVDAQTAALKQQQNVLDAVRTQVQQEKEAAFGMVMLALTFVSGPVLSWVAGRIQYKWFPKLTETPKVRERALWLSKIGNKEDWRSFQVLELDHDKVWAKIFGDLGKEVVGVGTRSALKVVKPDAGPAKNAVDAAANSNETSFKTSLENAMLAEAGLTIQAILSMAMAINENANYGAECLAKLKAKNPRLNDPKAKISEQELERMAKGMLREDINSKRKEWADQWFYYGYDHGSITGVAEAIEVELWALWILNERLKVVKHYQGSPDNPLVSAEVRVVEGRTFGGGAAIPGRGTKFGNRGVPEGLLVRLAELGVVEARTQLQRLRAIAAQGVKEETEAAAARERERQEQQLRASQEAIEDQEDSRSPNPELARFKRATQRAARKKQALPPARVTSNQPDPDRPLIPVGTSVDTQPEIDALEAWAKHHPLRLMAGTLRHVKRPLPSIEKILVRSPR